MTTQLQRATVVNGIGPRLPAIALTATNSPAANIVNFIAFPYKFFIDFFLPCANQLLLS
jgi:hypothetical protein